MPKIRSKKLREQKLELYEAVKNTYATGDYSMQEVADKFGRSLVWVYKVIHNKYLTK
jgi:transposase